MENLTVVIRTVGERTTKKCEELAKMQANDVVVISVSPFIHAVKKTFEVAAASENEWTLALDADVQLDQDAVSRILNDAHHELFKFFDTCRIDYLVRDKFRGKSYAGCHLYRNKYAQLVLDQMSFEYDPQSKRPESFLLSEFKKKNRLNGKASKIPPVGLHDHDQYYFHLFNKYLNRGFKDSKYHDELVNSVKDKKSKNPEDMDYDVVLCGLEASKTLETMLTDSKQYKDAKEVLEQLGLQEKNEL